MTLRSHWRGKVKDKEAPTITRKVLATELDKFWPAALDFTNSMRDDRAPLSMEQLKNNNKLAEFLDSAKEGDCLDYFSIYFGPTAAFGEFNITRSGVCLHKFNIWVS